MSDTLAVKYRPKTFEEVVEQDAVKAILTNQLKTGETKNAYLFEGPAGCGKTTSARLFAKALNGGDDSSIAEIDAASNNSVDDVRRIREDAKYGSLSSAYKVYILDECFHGETLVSTPLGLVPIKDISVGDEVYNMMGVSTVTRVHVNRVLTSRLCRVTINGVKTFTTVDHLYFTNNGWVEASKLTKGDVVYAPSYMRSVWKGIFQRTKGGEVLLQFLCAQGDGPIEAEETRNEILLDLWKAVLNDTKRQEKNVFQGMQSRVDSALKEPYVVEYASGGKGQDGLLKPHEVGQPDGQSENGKEDAEGKKIERLFAYLERTAGWKWAIHEATVAVVGSVGQGTYARICHTDESETGHGLPDVIQSRPRLSKREVGDRGGWEKSSIEDWYCQGFEEDGPSDVARVEGVEVYQRGNNDELFRRGFTDSELQGDFVTMYDLEVDGHHSYFANGSLVHNCHLLSASAWGALLKLLEEPPEKTAFILCTTDAQKVPQTIVSRVQTFRFTKISQLGIEERLDEICDMEYGCYPLTKDAVEYIAKQAQGGMREAISLMGKVLDGIPKESIRDDGVSSADVVKVLGTVDYGTMASLAESMLKRGQSDSPYRIVESVYSSGKDLKLFLRDFMSFAMDAVIFMDTENIGNTSLPPTDEWSSRMASLLNGVERSAALNLVDMLLRVSADVKWDPQPKTVIEAEFTLFREEFAK